MNGYFDWNATTPLADGVATVVAQAMERYWANPSALYRLGREGHLALENAREQVADLLAWPLESIVFTSGASEANNAVIRERAPGNLQPLHGERAMRLLISPLEHPSVMLAARRWWPAAAIELLPVDACGQVDSLALAAAVEAGNVGLVCVHAVNNETGVVQDWRAIAEICAAARVPYHCDAVQLPGKAAFGVLDGTCSVTLSGHKMGGPRGVGLLLTRNPAADSGFAVAYGGGQENGMRAGTENLPGILGMVAAMRSHQSACWADAQGPHRDAFEARLLDAHGDDLRIHGKSAPRVGNTSSLRMPGAEDAAEWVMRLDRQGFQVAPGAACSSAAGKISAGLLAMGVSEADARRTLRISSGWSTSAEDWQALAAALLPARTQRNMANPALTQVIEID